jgi:hypothetical protein
VSVGEVMTTSSTGGQKAGNDVRMSLLPVRELLEVAELYGKGAKKYSDHNWAKGYEWSKSYDALNRHAMEWWAGNEFDDGEGGTGQEHLDCVIFHALTLKYFRKHFAEFDDRFKIPKRPEEKLGEQMWPKVSRPREVKNLDEEWMREFEWRSRYLIYSWRADSGKPGWHYRADNPGHHRWSWSSENLLTYTYNNGPFTRD